MNRGKHGHESIGLMSVLFFCAWTSPAFSQVVRGENVSDFASIQTRVKNLVDVRGLRNNQISGLGLLIGLAGTGDSKASIATNQAASSLLRRFGFNVKPTEVATNNLAVVIVTADLPAFARIGDKIEVQVSSVGDATSLNGGTLLLTPMTGLNKQTYASAQGSEDRNGNWYASVERENPLDFIRDNQIELSLKKPDFTTANRIAVALNDYFGEFLATAVDANSIFVKVPKRIREENLSFNPVAFMSALEQVSVLPDNQDDFVVIDEQTGSIVSGGETQISPIAFKHGSIEIQIGKNSERSNTPAQPVTVSSLVRALGRFGAEPKDIVSILHSLGEAKALKAQIKLL